MQFNSRIAKFAISAATVLATVAMSMPASAATYTYQKVYYTTWYGGTGYYYKLVPVTSTAPTQPTTSTYTAPAPTTQTSTTTAATGLTAEEQQMLNLVNQERAKAGLPALKADLQLTKLARMKSQDMIAKNYFSHQSPTYGSPFDMMKTYGVTYRTAGENIAGNSSVTGAHTSLMNSSGHRANILGSQFTHVGIGIVKGGSYGMMFTQMFVGR